MRADAREMQQRFFIALVLVAASGLVACVPTPEAAPPPAAAPAPAPVPEPAPPPPPEPTPPAVPNPPVKQPGDAPTLTGVTCPVKDAKYTNDYGPRGAGFHAGIDMLVPTGTNVRAVRAGTVWNKPNDGAGGNAVYLTGDDGNVYLAVHLNDFVGADKRKVDQGTVIGHSGMTGNATAPHVHFEIRLGGLNGTRINPYNTLKAAGC